MLFPYTIEMNAILILFEGLHCYENREYVKRNDSEFLN
jgi:hypothetical protein